MSHEGPPSGTGTKPIKAPVVPRARVFPDGEVLPIEDLVRPFIEQNAVGTIQIVGPAGSGKSVAITHLASCFQPGELVLFDEPTDAQLYAAAGRGLVVFARRNDSSRKHLATL